MDIKLVKTLIIALIMLGIAIYMFNRYGSKTGPKKGFTVYGTDWCSYTTKQRAHLDNKYGPNSHKYINCEKNKGKCKGMTGFPVTVTKDGKRVKGFNTDL